jgi:hypothetical protein
VSDSIPIRPGSPNQSGPDLRVDYEQCNVTYKINIKFESFPNVAQLTLYSFEHLAHILL